MINEPSLHVYITGHVSKVTDLVTYGQFLLLLGDYFVR